MEQKIRNAADTSEVRENPKGKKPKKKKKIKYIILEVVFGIVFLVGLGILLYPTFSDLWNKNRNKHLISEYNHAVEELSDNSYDEILAEAEDYNAHHTVNTITDAFDEEGNYQLTHPYDLILNPAGDGIMGSIEIPKIHVDLAIYHGVGADVLEKGIGHLEGTSLPIGGEGTHAALSGHRGLPSAKLFTDLDQLEVGDVFYLHILRETLAYQVDQIKTVLPFETEDLAIEPGKDYVTLITCTPYGVNTHRLLIRGTRIPYTEEEQNVQQDVGGQTVTQTVQSQDYVKILIGGVILFVILLIIVVLIMRHHSKKK